MASVLATQLAQLASLKGPQEKWVRGKASLLFDYQRAADVGADTLLSIAQTGAAAGASIASCIYIRAGPPGGAAIRLQRRPPRHRRLRRRAAAAAACCAAPGSPPAMAPTLPCGSPTYTHTQASRSSRAWTSGLLRMPSRCLAAARWAWRATR